MICRLCLCECDRDAFLPIFNEDSKAHGLSKLIAKYFQIEVTRTDPVSINVCILCWRHLSDFEHFCAMVADKQQALQLKTEPPEPGLIVWNTECAMESNHVVGDVKDHILCEPEIDAALHNFSSDKDDRHDYSNSSDPNNECDRFEQTDTEDTATAAQQITPSDSSKNSKGRGRPRLKRLQKITAMKYEKHKQTKVVPVPLSTLRESRARARELKRNTDASSAAIDQSTCRPAPIVAEATDKLSTSPKLSSVGKKAKRGRPKGPSKVQPANLEAKRSTIREMDDYISANVRLDCCLCAAPLQDFTDLKRHFRIEHNCTGYMQCCNNRYKKRTLYVDHLHYHKDPEYFSCKPCHKNFLNRNSQDMHMLRFHSEQQELVHQCEVCEARFAKKFLLTMHLKGHKGTERPEACETCAKTFRTKIELAAHEKRMHDADFTPVICDICGVNFRSKANFLIHKKSLHPDGPVPEVQCHLCGRWLRDERSLRKHLVRHDDREGNNKYNCKLCGAEKSSRVALSSHMRYHHSSKRHKCTLCSKEFKLPRALAEHMATHTGVDLYSCPFCTRTFKSHANMHNHKKKMHPNEWVRKYTQPSALGVTTSTSLPPPLQGIVSGVDDDLSAIDESQQTSTSSHAAVAVYDIINLSAS
ncbi:transcription factor grauzone-like [Scaptodrosophila lebanonensis]|uniref:Transcription factor grauzone-like n=1 Tax=Drosophila lebanonensis TaxID=7225 RepID=A0A6J2U1R2_DROLE|nr:transcription factor grauzone-like [Scaptodrosophila lebanonensis]